MTKSLVYLASPYSHPSLEVEEARFQAACQAAGHLMRAGVHVFSPIAHTHPIKLVASLPGSWDYWRDYDESMLSACRALVVLQLEGWDLSSGVAGEIEIAERIEIPVYYVTPCEDNLELLADELRVTG